MIQQTLCILTMMLVLGCSSLPHFGVPVSEAPDEKLVTWKKNLPSECTIKHVTTVSLGKNNEIDIIGYLLIKNEDFRLLGMNELGFTLFDIYRPKNKPFLILKSFPELEQYNVVANMVRDIELIFFSPYLQQQTLLQHYKTDTTRSSVAENQGNWVWWTTGKEQKLIKEGYYQNTIREIYYHDTNDVFPEEIEIFYPKEKIKIKLEILEIEEKHIEDHQINPEIQK